MGRIKRRPSFVKKIVGNQIKTSIRTVNTHGGPARDKERENI